MLRSAVAALVLFGSAPLAAEVVATSADGFVTRTTVTVAASPRATWLALTKPADWWNGEHTWSGDAANMTLIPQAGGCFCERIPGEDGKDGFSLDGSVQHAVVVQAYPLKVLRLRGGLGPLQSEPAEAVLTITLKEVDGGTRILWEYNVGGPMRYKPAELAPVVDGVLNQQIKRLRDHLGALEDPAMGTPDAAVEAKDATGPNVDAEGTGEDDATLEAQIDALADG